MGRVLSEDRRRAAIGFWAEQLHGCRPTGRALFRRLYPDQAQAPSASAARLFTQAAKELKAACSWTQFNAWVAKHLVDRGPALLIDDCRRQAVLAAIRDRDRKDRRKAVSQHVVQVVLSAIDLRRLTSYAEATGCGSLGEAVGRLVREATGVRQRQKKPTSRALIDDMFAALPPDNGEVLARRPERQSRPARKNA